LRGEQLPIPDKDHAATAHLAIETERVARPSRQL
jgi:hypothetical protein